MPSPLYFPGIRFEFFSLSDPGRVRTKNEDTVCVLPRLGLVALADGMGGYRAGEVASAMAVDLLLQRTTSALLNGVSRDEDLELALREGFEQANEAILRASVLSPEHRGMGTTLVAALFHEHHLWVGHIGDSRLYRLRQGQMVALTKDHSVVQEQLDAGQISAAMAHRAPHRHLLTRALGAHSVVNPDLSRHVVLAGDTYLLCSDGLHDMMSERQMTQILRREPSLEAAGRRLVQTANDAGGLDNVTVALVRCSPEDGA